jgi:antagonist of KipI
MDGMIVEKAGLLDTIQDHGRYGYQASGMVVAGAMDPYSFQLGNVLLGNDRNASSLEVTLLGPRLRFPKPTQIVISGGNLSPAINGQPVPMWQVLSMHVDDVLSFGSVQSGCRVYLAIKGGFQVEEVMGSRSTYLKGQIGGWEGRALKSGDVIPYQNTPTDKTSLLNMSKKQRGISLSHDLRPDYEQDKVKLRVVLGPQLNRFTEKGISHFLEEPYQVTPQMDRMGLRLKGKEIEHSNGADILSDAIPFGGIQVPENGQPIVLLADRQTTGGYAKIGCIIAVDLPKAAQVRPNQLIYFQCIEIQEAQALYREQEKLFKSLSLILSQ